MNHTYTANHEVDPPEVAPCEKCGMRFTDDNFPKECPGFSLMLYSQDFTMKEISLLGASARGGEVISRLSIINHNQRILNTKLKYIIKLIENK